MTHIFRTMIDRYGMECTLIFVRMTTLLLLALMCGLIVVNFFYTGHKIDKGFESITSILRPAEVIKQ